ncbi:hypothetical protein [Pectobacterium parmentieri]|uniref:Uncharacterized protein n=1 Tax=Pectobacterium parmentieri TaxID=1905730 RepID=A0A8B3FBR7_PECPM|nr:hypothetical protein [Pectobacterium parmentieri]AOR57365.1 hypothetical protein A8F97_00345 [Pectobacterium parmentieri]AYH11591.1 hypothetical protein C5E24_18825 [Pectobacterium parmentieri]AYH17692.1 hypothetical protein C5E22_03945 [Pectobacterium parmentieri]AYH37871.1 hypothetical protein C5E17_18570 [Pectobacterium parmentieri]AZS58099.1 hypothetical protein C5E18_19255 [Pectobacterium parmentieri]
MNYQSTSLFIYTTRIFFAICLCGALAVAGISAPVFYLLAMKLAYPVILSLRLHRLSEKGIAFLPKEKSEWMVYVHGIPVRETRTSLTNPYFFSAESIRTFSLRAYIGKLLVQICAVILLVQQTITVNWPWLYLGVVVAALWFAYAIAMTIIELVSIMRDRWFIEKLVSPSQSEWFGGYIDFRGYRVTVLERLLSLK